MDSIIEFLVKQSVVFLCVKCGETIEMRVPAKNNRVTRSYCCSATYQVSNERGLVAIERLADKENREMKDEIVRVASVANSYRER